MHPVHHSISIHFARCLIDKSRDMALDTEHLMAHSGLSDSLLEKTDLRITPKQLSKLLLELWLMADDECMGMASDPIKHGVFALLAGQLIHCTTLAEVYQYCAKFYNLISSALTVTFDHQPTYAEFSIQLTEPEKDGTGMLRELLLLIWHRFPSWLVGQRIPLMHVALQQAKPAHSAEHRLMYPCEMHYEQIDNHLRFDAALLTLPVVQTPTTLREYLPQLPLEWFKRQAYYPVFTRRVKDYLEDETELVNVNMEQIARHLQMTTRTLRRKLSEEGTSFQLLKDEIRRDAAIHYLSQPTMGIATIAELLGFSEPAAFARAFKQWTGVSPSVYRLTPKN